jgi:uncharacterized protein YmfQ (DUF2313 family)
MAGSFDDDLDIEGKHLDDAYYDAMGILSELFPGTSENLITAWQTQFGTDSTGSLAAQQAELVTKERVIVNKNSRLSKQYYIDVALGMGYVITIAEGVDNMFIVASTSPPATLISAPLYEANDIFKWTIHALTVPLASQPYFEEVMLALAPAWTQLLFNYVS